MKQPKKMHIAVIEGNHEALVDRAPDGTITGSITGAAEGFAKVLGELQEGLSFSIYRPHFEGFDLGHVDFSDCDGVVFTGSANHWSADDPLAAPARATMEKAFHSGTPVFGSCYGLQLAVAVLGGQNRANPEKTEFAIAREISVNQAGRNHPLYAGKPDFFDAKAMHRDEIAILPQGAISLASNQHSAHQAMVYEDATMRFWGVQYHPELSFSDLAHYMIRNEVSGFSDAKAFAHDLGIAADLNEIIADFVSLDAGVSVALQDKYALTDSVINPVIHRGELVNFLNSLA